MNSLTKILERFNRKERNLLVRAVLGHHEKALQLSPLLCQSITSKLGLSENALTNPWWATDYHLDWLAGGLTIYLDNDADALLTVRPNHSEQYEKIPGQGIKRRIVEGTQEDVDLLIATEHEMIFVEAKAYGSWSNQQMGSKLQRLDLLYKYYHEHPSSKARPIGFHILLVSPKAPEKLRSDWPAWAYRENIIPWMKLDLDLANEVLGVSRCNSSGKPDAGGSEWRLIEYKTHTS